MADELPPIVTRLLGDITGLQDALVKSKAEVAAWRDEVQSGGRDVGKRLGTDIGDGIQDAIPTAFGGQGGAGSLGQKLGTDIGVGLGQGLGDSAPLIEDEVDKKVKEPLQKKGSESGAAFTTAFTATLADTLTPSRVVPDYLVGDIGKKGAGAGDEFAVAFGKSARDGLTSSTVASVLAPDGPVGQEIARRAQETGDEAGKAAGNAAAGGMSPLIKAAFVTAAAIGPAALVAGTATAVAGAAALILKQNQVINADYQKLGSDVGMVLKNATAPLAGDVHDALGALDSQVVGLQPKLQGLFAAATPDLSALVGGLGNFTGQVLPGLTAGLSGSQVIVTDFSNSLGPLGSGVGSFFQNVVRDASTEGAALQHVVGTLGNAFSALGTVVGSASADASSALLAITPAVNGVLTAVQKVSNPATVGGVAGFFGAMKIDPALGSGLSKASDGMLSLAEKAEKAGGPVGKLAGTALGGATGLSKMADVISGPWGLAIGAGVGLATALGAALFNASHATDAVKVASDQLAQAVAQDGGKVGESTTAFLAQQDAANGLADTASKAGVSLATLAQAAAGNKDALAQLTGSVDKSNLATRQQAAAQDDATRASQGFTSFTQQQTYVSDHAAAATNKLTDANQKLVNSVKAQAQQTADAINKQTQLMQATNALNDSTNIFNATLAADYQGLIQKAQQTSDATVAALGLGGAQTALNQKLAGSLTDYQMAQAGASAYAGVLTAASGAANSLFGAQTSLDAAMQALTTSFKTNGFTIADNTTAGIANRQAIENAAKAAQGNADAVYQSEVNTKGATQAYTDANSTLAKSKAAFEAAAIAAGGNRQQVQALADQLFALPPSVTTTVTANTSPARAALSEFVHEVNTSSGVVTIYGSATSAGSSNLAKGSRAYADGGFVDGAPGQPVPATVHGQEYVLSQGMLSGRQAVDPAVLAALRASAPASSGPAGVALAPTAAAAAAAPPVVNVYIDGNLVTAGVRTSAQRYARRNSGTGLT